MNYYAFQYDPEATIQEADIWLAEQQTIDKRFAEIRRNGGCTHGSSIWWIPEPVYPEQRLLEKGQGICTELCGRIFDSEEEYMQVIREL